ncbi:MAG TPA: hypothetical protein VFO76_11170, partial [Candidatus Kapabacteria bacterium]|nr:hypothetical protein [Candidatus Kapabacteria bacterium]
MKFVTHNKKPYVANESAFKVAIGKAFGKTDLQLPYAPKGRLGFLVGDVVIDLEQASLKYAMAKSGKLLFTTLPSDIIIFLCLGEEAMAQAKEVFVWCMAKTDDELRAL